MKIVDRKTFLAMPAETIFSKYEPCVFHGFSIKGDTVGTNDFCYQQITDAVDAHDSGEYADILERAQELGESFRMDFDCQGRDGCFDGPDTFFAVWEREDISALIDRLFRAMRESDSKNLPSDQ